MRRFTCVAATLALVSGPATLALGQDPADPGGVARMDALLNAWAQQSAQAKTLDAKFTRVDVVQFGGKIETHYQGRAMLQAPNKACIDLVKVVKENPKGEFYERIICNGQEVYHVFGPTRQIDIHPLGAQNRKQALEEGPLPFLFNMRVDDAKRRYQMTLLEEDPTRYLIQIVPRLPVDRDSFIKATVRLNKTKFLPETMVLVAPNGKDTETYTFTDIKRDVTIQPENFNGALLVKQMKTWKVNDLRGGQGVRPASVPLPAQPAQRPRSGLRLRN